MKHSSSSKNPKKISDEDRSKKKKIKSKSAKRRRSRRDSSTSSYSDSDSEEISRSRRKSSKSKKLVDNRKGGLKKSFKKSLRKKKRSRRDPSVSESSSGCSTCSDSDRPRSPVRKSKVRKKESARGRKRSHLCESSQVTGRNRSPSSPTCNGGGRSRSSSGGQRWSPIEERFERKRKRKRSAPIKGRVESSCERSPIEERLGSSYGRSPIDDRFERSRGGSPIDNNRFESSQGWSPIEDRFGGSCKKWSPIEDRYGNSQGLSPIDDRFGCGRGLSPIVERYESGHRQSPIDDRFETGGWSPLEQRFDRHGQNPIDGRFESSHGRSPTEDRDWEHGGTKRLRSVLVVTKLAGEDGNVIMAYNDYPSSRSNEFCGEGNNKRDLNAEGKEKDPCDARLREEVISSNDRIEDEGNEAVDLELILRQKALENFKKFRGIRHAKLETLDKKCEISEPESYQCLKNFDNTVEHKHHSSIDEQRYVQGGNDSNNLKGSSISNISTDKVEENSVRILSNAQNTLSRLKRVQESSNKISSEQTSPANNNQSRGVGAQPSSVKVSGTEVDTADNPASGACNTGILRQKALENFKKFRGIRHAKLETIDKKGEISEPESYQCSKNVDNMLEHKNHSSIDEQRYVQGETDSNNLKGSSISNISTDKVDENSVRILSNAQNTLSRLKRVQGSSNKTSSEQTSLANNNQSRGVGAQPSSVKVNVTEVDTSDNPASGACNTGNENLKSDEPMVESASGSQFEQKSFSRMHDGETVQVSYKVYIPKKTPALARRKLQR